ncbi:MAG: FAD-dependent oxidoreductase [Solirubrobacteraceae bacterium]|nr:FAD-dependent oxidoreductase [Solirubrobacteraceae bacterium]
MSASDDGGSADRAPTFVVGAGPSGLAAAWRLRRHGRPVVVLEQRDRVGGQVSSHRHDGFLMEEGASLLPSAYAPVLRLVREAGLEGELVPAGSVVGFAHDGRIHELRSERLLGDALRTRIVSARSKLAMLRLGVDGLRMQRRLDCEDLSGAADLDTLTPREYCAARWGLDGEVYHRIVDPTVRGIMGTRGDETSVVELFFLLSNILGSELFALRDGYSALPRRLARDLDVRLGATVHGVEERPGGVRVAWEDADGRHEQTGDACVVAIAADRIPGLVPTLDPDTARFLGGIRYTASMTVNVGLTRPPAGIAASVVQLPRGTADPLMSLTLEHHKAPGRVPDGRGLVCILTESDWSQRHLEDDDEAVTSAALAAAEEVLPGISDDVTFAHVARWSPCVVASRPGLYRELRDWSARRQPGRVALAGTFTSSSNVASATAAGERAAREVLTVTARH